MRSLPYMLSSRPVTAYRPMLNVSEFGVGYWIGAGYSTMAVLHAPLGFQGNAMLLVGIGMSLASISQGKISGNRNTLIGGWLGLLLCVWPFVRLILYAAPLLVASAIQH